MKTVVKRAAAVSIAGVLLIAGFEGKENEAYLDPVRIPTICYGHTEGVRMGQWRSDSQCLDLLEKDAQIASNGVLRHVKVPLSQQELDAYTSFAFNVGVGAFSDSTLLRKLNAGDRFGACDQLLRWVYAKGKKLKGLVIRRDEERQLCLEGARLW